MISRSSWKIGGGGEGRAVPWREDGQKGEEFMAWDLGVVHGCHVCGVGSSEMVEMLGRWRRCSK